MEIWELIEKHDNYLISNLGRVKNSKGFILSNKTLRGGYPCVRLNRKTESLHRLVATAFIKNDHPDSFTVVNHIDGNKMNAVANNLEWINYKNNTIHAVQLGLSKPHFVKVHKCNEFGEILETFSSIKEASEKTGVSSKHIPSVCTGKRKTAGGWKWKYDEDPTTMIPDGKIVLNIYVVCKNGKIYNKKTSRELKPNVLPSGYMKIGLSENGKVKHFLVHRLVAEAYLKHLPDQKYVNHIDGNKSNNNVSNLEWCTASENMKHASNSIIKYKTISVSQHDKNGVMKNKFNSIKEAALKTGVDNSSIVKACKGKVRYAGGYIWKYVN